MIVRAAVLAALLVATAVRAETFESTQWAMGTTLRVVAPDPIDAAIVQEAMARVHATESRLSTWRDDTPLSRFNRAPAGSVEIDLRLYEYLRRVKKDSARTGGAFDPSVGTLWVDAGAPIGMELLEFHNPLGTGLRAVKPHDAYAIDSGADGKGVGVDHMVRVFREAGVEDYLIDFGGSSWAARGRRDENTPWRVALRHEGRIVGTLDVGDRALSISSTVQIDVGEDGAATRRLHIIDPRTRNTVQVSRTVAVLAPTATEAEVFSTALVVDGFGRGKARWFTEFVRMEVVVVEDGQVVAAGPSFTPRPQDE